MLAARRASVAALAILAGMTSPARSMGGDTPADLAARAVIEFCLPTLRGADVAQTAATVGLEQRDSVTPRIKAWADRNGGGTVYGFGYDTGKLVVLTKTVRAALACDVAVFGVAAEEGTQAFEKLDAIFTERRYRLVKGMPGEYAKAYKGDQSLIILLGPRPGADEGDPQLHVAMKRRLYTY